MFRKDDSNCKKNMSKLVKLESSYGVLIVEVEAETYEQADSVANEIPNDYSELIFDLTINLF